MSGSGRADCGSLLRGARVAIEVQAVFGGGFRMMEYPGYRPLVYAQTHTASLFLEEPEEVRAYRGLLRELAVHALDAGQSREWLAALASEHDRAEGDIDDPAGPATGLG